MGRHSSPPTMAAVWLTLLVTHAVIQQRVDKHADTRPVFPRGGIGFKALPYHFGHDVIQAGIDGLNVGKRHHTHPVI